LPRRKLSDQEHQRKIIEAGDLPRHVAVIMDGNGRWARQRGLPRVAGHRAARKSVRDTVEAAAQLGLNILTLYTFSRENWNRPDDEVNALMGFLKDTLREEIDDLKTNNVVLNAVGRIDELPKAVRAELENAIETLSENDGLILNLALSYSGRTEILDAVRKIVGLAEAGEISEGDIDETVFKKFLYAPKLPDPDLLIRTSGEVRLSNFLLWQIAYAEIWITPVLWPDFRRRHLYQAIESFQVRERRFGKVT
jgi:undecaprenyl diphosphate synthase